MQVVPQGDHRQGGSADVYISYDDCKRLITEGHVRNGQWRLECVRPKVHRLVNIREPWWVVDRVRIVHEDDRD